MSIDRRLFILVIVWTGAACGYRPPQPPANGALVKTATARQVEGCAYLGNFIGAYGKGAVIWAQRDVQNLAAAAGATHVVWGPLLQTTISGQAYRCP